MEFGMASLASITTFFNNFLLLKLVLLTFSFTCPPSLVAEETSHANAASASPQNLLPGREAPFNKLSTSREHKASHYYFVGAFLAHPYVRDIKEGFRYAREKLGVEITTLGPQDANFDAQAIAMKEAINAQPDGIIIPLWADNAIPYIRKAQEDGIPVIAIEAAPQDHGADTYVGLNNYKAGLLTAQELVKKGGTEGKLALVLNKASNTDLKRKGVLDFLKNTGWEVVVEVNDMVNTDTATRVCVEMLRDHPELTAIIGLNSSSGVGIGNAIGQLGFTRKGLTIVVHDREDTVLEFIEKGFIDATIVANTALMTYLSVVLLEDYQQRIHDDIPIAANSRDSGLVLLPEEIDIGAIVVDKTNVKHFMRNKMSGIVE